MWIFKRPAFQAIISLPSFLRYPLAKLISKRRTPIAKAIYAEMGGKSPILEETQLNPSSLELEITETIFLNYNENLQDEIKKLQQLGVNLVLDDFA